VKLYRVLAVGAIASLLSACAGGGQSVPNLSTEQQTQNTSGGVIASRTIVEDGVTMHVLPARGVTVGNDVTARGVLARSSSSNLVWNGGPVQVTPKIYIVYWGPNWTSADPEYTTLNGFMSKMAGGAWINIDTQYSGSNGTITNPNSQLAGTWIDSSAIPSKPSSSQVGAEAQKAAQHFGYGGVNANYIVALQSGSDPSGFIHQWCAWHSSESESEGVVSYTDFPYQSDAGPNCGSGSVNSPGTYDGVSIVSGHEEAETQTDPQPSSGWTDSSGSEIGDKCAWQNLEDNPNAGGYPTQPLWDNKISGCAQSGP
jgi:serine protease